MEFKSKDIISIRDFSKEDLLYILDISKKFEKDYDSNLLNGHILATLFFEPSTRTRLSFSSAMSRLGGKVIGFDNPASTSVSKGESLLDTIKIVEGYSDIIVMRHPIDGAARFAAETAKIPIINAGDGVNQHPTQTLLDLYTIQKSFGKLENLNIGFVGDLKYGRTVHSLAHALSHFKAKMYFISPPQLKMPKDDLEQLDKEKIKYTEGKDLSKVANKLDILYMTRIQKERFPDPIEYQKLKGCYRIDKTFLENTKKGLKVMHPLPRVDELCSSCDGTEKAIYFEQAHNGVTVRMALLSLLLKKIKNERT
ncbi:aspartate carbamoyltransferase [Candidatus Woesearchaeota archaeon]|nr:aspartate carbamoyltransferase [Candidatus Woesearchaeota archaeon]|tara:strand:- start:8605 stop:9534 length:930 start_codon:yes stop_codon:yes gene_type:complete